MNYILCPVRNGLHLTQAAVRTFLAQDIGNVEVLIIDNCSQDGTTQWLWSQPVRAVRFCPGKSVAASWNFGLKQLFGEGAEHVCVVNNDVELRPDTLRHLVADGGLFVTAVGTRDRSKIEPGMAMVFAGDDLLPSGIKRVYDAPDASHKRPHPDFSCYLIRRECWERVGEFDENFKGAYAEDADFHARMNKLGITAYCLDLPFLHYGAQTLKLSEREDSLEIMGKADANRAYFKSKWGVEVGSPEYYSMFGHDAPTEEAVESTG